MIELISMRCSSIMISCSSIFVFCRCISVRCSSMTMLCSIAHRATGSIRMHARFSTSPIRSLASLSTSAIRRDASFSVMFTSSPTCLSASLILSFACCSTPLIRSSTCLSTLWIRIVAWSEATDRPIHRALNVERYRAIQESRHPHLLSFSSSSKEIRPNPRLSDSEAMEPAHRVHITSYQDSVTFIRLAMRGLSSIPFMGCTIITTNRKPYGVQNTRRLSSVNQSSRISLVRWAQRSFDLV
jgi:hypothetical protein